MWLRQPVPGNPDIAENPDQTEQRLYGDLYPHLSTISEIVNIITYSRRETKATSRAIWRLFREKNPFSNAGG